MKGVRSIVFVAVLVAVSLGVVVIRVPESARAKDTSDLEVQAQAAFAQSVSIGFSSGVPGAPNFQIPPGQRLVIEQVTGTIRILDSDPDDVEAFALETYLETNGTSGLQNDELHQHRLAFSGPRIVDGYRIYNVSQTTRIYADSAISWPVVRALAPGGRPDGTGDMTISGYLIPVPSP